MGVKLSNDDRTKLYILLRMVLSAGLVVAAIFTDYTMWLLIAAFVVWEWNDIRRLPSNLKYLYNRLCRRT